VKARTAYYTVRLSNVSSYVTSTIPNGVSINELLYKYNFSIGDKKGFHIPDESELNDEQLNRMKRVTEKIILLEKFEKTSDMLKKTVIKKTADEDIFNRILMREIEDYENEKIVGSLLEAEYKCSKFSTYNSLIESIHLKYSDASELFAFLRYKAFEFRKLLEENKLQEAYEINILMNQKLGM
jgi:hypothetical protein